MERVTLRAMPTPATNPAADPQTRQQPEDHGDPARHAQIVIAALVVQLLFPGEQLLGRHQHAAHATNRC